MLIRVAIFLILYLLVVKASFGYRDAVRSDVINSDPDVQLAREEPKASSDFQAAVHKYKIGDPRRTQAISELADVRYQRLLLPDAERIYRLATLETAKKGKFSADYEEAALRMGQVLTTADKLPEARGIYTYLLTYDREFFPKNDPAIARDLNNLGLNSYLIAQGQERGEQRIASLKQSLPYFAEALGIYKSQPKSEKSMLGTSVVLSNQYLALRDLDDIRGAELAKREAASIDAQFKRPCELP